MSGFLSGLALVFLTLVGYSSGAMIAARGRQVAPELPDVVGVVVLWGIALATRGGLQRWLALGIWILVGLLVGAVGARVRRSRYPREQTTATPDDTKRLRRWWTSWKAFGLRIGSYQSRMWLAFFYFLVVFPLGLAVRLFKDPLRMKTGQSKGGWAAREKAVADLDSVRSQF